MDRQWSQVPLGTLFGKQNIQAKELVYLIRQYCLLSTVWNSSRMERRAPYVIPKGSCVLYLWKHNSGLSK